MGRSRELPAEVINTRYEVIETEPVSGPSVFTVAKARDVVEGRVITLQMLTAAHMTASSIHPNALRAAVSEARRLDHPHIRHVFDQGSIEATGDFFIASEYIRGITLQERIRRVAPFSLTVAVDIAVAITEALEYAHRLGVTHGDLRPANVLLSPEGQIKVANFAYGRVAEAGAPQASMATADGDLFAVGALLFEMLTGTAPPLADQAEPPSPRISHSGVPPALDGIVQKAMHPDRALRYRSAETLLLDLQAVRDALRTGRSLTWSPLTDRRSPRPPAEATVIGARRSDFAAPPPVGAAAARENGLPGQTPMADAAEELEGERFAPLQGQRTNPLGKILGVVFVLAVLAVIGLVWYGSQFLAIPNDVPVPNLVGKTMDEARALGAQQHFEIAEGGSDYSAKWPEDQIYQQDPLPGRTIKAEKAVTVFRSLGPRLLKVPQLLNETKARAESDLSDVGLPEGTVTEQFSDAVQRGVVISQTPDADSMVARNAAVNYVVSKGRQPPDPPGGIEGNADTPVQVSLRWDAAPRADSYTVYRTLDGTTTTLIKGLTDTHYVDKGLTPDTAYSYSVDAVNASGASGASDPALVTTPAKPVADAVLPSDTQVITPGTLPATSPTAPDAPPATTPAPTPTARLRQFTIAFRVPRHPNHERLVEIEVQDITGTNLVYSEKQDPGEEISVPVQAFGNKITFRIFMDKSLTKQQTL